MTTNELVVEARLRDELSAPLKKVGAEVKVVGEEVDTAGKKSRMLGGNFESLAASGSKTAAFLGNTLRKAAHIGAVALLAAAAATVVLARKFVDLASSAQKSTNRFEKVFGAQTASVKAWVDRTSNLYGRTTQSLEDATAKFAIIGKAAKLSGAQLPGFSTRLAQAGLDLASFNNADPQAVFQAITSGLAGMTRPLRQYGIFVTKQAVDAQAATDGLSGKLTDQQAIMVRSQVILNHLGAANGDLARSQDSLANRTLAFKGRLQQLETQIGTGLMPVAGELIGFLEKKMAPVMARLTAEGPKIQKAWDPIFKRNDWKAMAVELDTVLGGGGKHVAGIQHAGEALGRFVHGIPGDLKVVAHVLGVVFGTLAKWGGYLYTIWRDGVAPAFSSLGDSAGGAEPSLDAISSVLKFIADHAKTLSPLIGAVTAAWLAYKAAALVAAAAQWVMNDAADANPYVILAAAIAALVYLVVRLYQKNKTFRDGVNDVGHAVGWLAKQWKDLAILIGSGLLLGPVGLLLGVVIELYRRWKPFHDLVNAFAHITFDGIKSAVGWIVGKLEAAIRFAERLAKAGNGIGGWVSRGAHSIGLGDTARPMARRHAGGRVARRAGTNLAHTLAVHGAADRATPGSRKITSSIRNYALGSPNSDHTTGRAIDVVGPNLNTYGRHIRAAGGFAEFHGSGPGRHLHAAIGDTARPMASTGAGGAVGNVDSLAPIVIEIAPGAIIVYNPASGIELDQAIADGIARYLRDRQERALPR